jgi:dihydrofolate reductase
MMRHRLIGHAIVSADGYIADENGRMPKPLMIDSDWQRFQADLDASDATLIGRLGHEAHPNAKGRHRIVLTGGVSGLVEGVPGPGRVDRLNPADVSLADALDTLFPAATHPAGARIAVVGGMAVFDHVLATTGYVVFDLVTVERVQLGEGRPCFSGQGARGPAAHLAANGYEAGPAEWLEDGVALSRFRRA